MAFILPQIPGTRPFNEWRGWAFPARGQFNSPKASNRRALASRSIGSCPHLATQRPRTRATTRSFRDAPIARLRLRWPERSRPRFHHRSVFNRGSRHSPTARRGCYQNASNQSDNSARQSRDCGFDCPPARKRAAATFHGAPSLVCAPLSPAAPKQPRRRERRTDEAIGGRVKCLLGRLLIALLRADRPNDLVIDALQA